MVTPPSTPREDSEERARTIIEYVTADHTRLHGLLDQAMAQPQFNKEAFAAFRRGLLRHIAIEEKLLFPAVRQARGGVPLDRAHELRIDHAALTSLLVPTPDQALCQEILSLLSAHDTKEETPGGIYDECAHALSRDQLVLLGEQAAAFPEVRVVRHSDGSNLYRTAEAALASARRLPASQRKP